MPEAGKFSVGDYVSIPGRVVKTDYVGQRLDRCVKVETATGTQEWFRDDDLAPDVAAVGALREALGYARGGFPSVSSQIQDRLDVVQVAVDRLREIPEFGGPRPHSAALRSWSLPAPPPEDVTVVHVEGDEHSRSWRRSGATHWLPVRPDGGAPVSWADLLDRGTVVEGGFPVPPPVFERGFYRLTRDLDGLRAGLVFLNARYADGWQVLAMPDNKHSVTDAALAAAGAERVED